MKLKIIIHALDISQYKSNAFVPVGLELWLLAIYGNLYFQKTCNGKSDSSQFFCLNGDI